jgi:hypothetical protein
MVPEAAISLAMQSGWKATRSYSPEQLAVTLSFWTALGRALDWKGTEWFHNARRFYDLVQRQADTEEFWQDVLQVKQRATATPEHIRRVR